MASQTDRDATQEYARKEPEQFRYDRGTRRMLKLMMATIVVFAVVMIVSLCAAVFLPV